MRVLMLLLLLFCFVGGFPTMAKPAEARPQKGFRFPALQVRYTQYKKRWRLYLRRFHFTKIVGKKPFVMLYFLPGHAPSELELRALDALQKKWKDQFDCLAIAPIKRYRDIKKVVARLKKLRVDLPVLLDERNQLSYVTLTRRAPSYAAVSRKGYLRLTGAASLTERVAPGTTMLSFLKKLKAGHSVPFTRAPGFSPNPFDWIGKKMLPWRASKLVGSGQKRLSRLRKTHASRPLLVLFGSVTCEHCRRMFKQLQAAISEQKLRFGVVSFVQADTKPERQRTIQFMRQHTVPTPILLAPKGKMFDLYHANALPTLMLLDGKGVIRSIRVGARGSLREVIAGMLATLRAKTPKKASKK